MKNLIKEMELDIVNTDGFVDQKDMKSIFCEKQILEIIKSILKNPDLNIEKEQQLHSIGFDSVSFVNLIVELEEIFKVEFDDSKLSIDSFDSIESFLGYVETIMYNK